MNFPFPPRKIRFARRAWVSVALVAFAHIPATSQSLDAQPAQLLHASCGALGNCPKVAVDPAHPYPLAELIDIAESNNPETRIAWQQALIAADQAGIARSAYLPQLAGFTLLGNQKFINPFPRPLATHGFTMVEMPVANAGMEVNYTLFDTGARRAHLEAAKAGQLAAASHFQRVHQDVAYAVILAYYGLVDAQQTLAARDTILATARTIQEASEAQLANGRATLPDVLNARAETARAELDREASVGLVQEQRVKLRKLIGVEPSDEIQIAEPTAGPSDVDPAQSIAELTEQAADQRPDLLALAAQLRAARQNTRAALSAYGPTISFNAKGSVESIWPTVSTQLGSTLADTTQFVWSTGLQFNWDFFDGGRRRNEYRARLAEQHKAAEELRAGQDDVAEATWQAFVQYRTAQRRQLAATALLTAADSSYQASLEAYKLGVKDLIDLVHAETVLAQARLADVEARSDLRTRLAQLGYATGSLLRQPQAPAQPQGSRP